MNAKEPGSAILVDQPAIRSIGTILIDAGVLSHDDAERVARMQTEQNMRFGDAAILLGLLSEDQLRFALSKQFNYSYVASGPDSALSTELVAAYQPFGKQAEQLRALRSQIAFRWFNRAQGQNALAIVSWERGVGRSYMAANLAVVFAQLGERVLLIDADMRSPRQHELFGLDNRRGLSMLLSGRSDEDSLQVASGFENLSVLTSGPTPPNPQELVNQPVFKAMLDAWSERFDIILVDTSAMGETLDAQAVAQRTAGVLTVARRDLSSVTAYADMLTGLRELGVTPVGSVFNAPPAARSSHV